MLPPGNDDFNLVTGMQQGEHSRAQNDSTAGPSFYGRRSANSRGFAFGTAAAGEDDDDTGRQRRLAVEGRQQEQRQLMEAARLSRVGWPDSCLQPGEPRVLNDYTESDDDQPGDTPSGDGDEYMEEAAGTRRGDDVAD